MSVLSMTGYGSSQTQAGPWVIRVECRSVNHRGLDTRVYLPADCRALEPEILQLIKATLSRGRVEVRVDLTFAGQADAQSLELIDSARFGAVYRELQGLSQQYDLAGSVSLRDVLIYKDRFQRDAAAQLDDQAQSVLSVAQEALAQLVESRRQEGQGIGSDLLGHIDIVERQLAHIQSLLAPEMEAFRGRLQERLQETLESYSLGQIDQEKLMQEMVFYADRADISEELQRADSHCHKLRELLSDTSHSNPRGKRTDFYLQELMREANTMGSKNQSMRIADAVIEIKSSVEKMREQVANIE